MSENVSTDRTIWVNSRLFEFIKVLFLVEIFFYRARREKMKAITRGIGQDGRQSRSIDSGNERGVSLLRIVLERVVDVGLRHWEEDSIDDMNDAIGGLYVGFDNASPIHRDHLSNSSIKGKRKKRGKKIVD